MDHVARGIATDDPIRQGFEHPFGLAAHRQLDRFDIVGGAAVILADDHVLRDVNQAPRQVTGVGGFERGIGQRFARAVTGDKELQHVHAFPQVGLDRDFDRAAAGIAHVAAHTGQLLDLVDVATGTGLRHHIDRVVAPEIDLERLGNFIGCLQPGLDNRLVAALVVEQPALEAAIDLVDSGFRFVHILLFDIGNDHVENSD